MNKALKDYLVSLAIEPDRFSEFVANPNDAAQKAGLSIEDQTIILSGDHNLIYRALHDQAASDSN